MSKPTSLKARFLESRGKWVLNVPAELSDTGKRRQLIYDTEKAAAADIETYKARVDNFGISLTALTPARIAEAAEGYKLLEPHGIGILEAIRGFLAVHRERTASIPFLDLFDLFLDAKKGRAPQYLRELRFTRDRWPQLHQRLASEITARELESLLAAISPGARNPILRYWRAVFNYGIKRGYCSANPVAKLDFEERVAKEVETLTNGQVEAMLQHAAEHDLSLLPFLVLGIFCGIRPDSEGELLKIEWRDIDLRDKVVVIRPEVSKTKRRRFIDLSDNAKAWLQLFISKAGIQQGKITTYNESQLRTHRTANWTAGGITKWPQQGMRHTYCSNWLAKHNDINKLVIQSGHDSVDTMWRHYHRGTTRKDANKFWRIRPSKSDKIISIKSARAA